MTTEKLLFRALYRCVRQKVMLAVFDGELLSFFENYWKNMSEEERDEPWHHQEIENAISEMRKILMQTSQARQIIREAKHE